MPLKPFQTQKASLKQDSIVAFLTVLFMTMSGCQKSELKGQASDQPPKEPADLPDPKKDQAEAPRSSIGDKKPLSDQSDTPKDDEKPSSAAQAPGKSPPPAEPIPVEPASPKEEPKAPNIDPPAPVSDSSGPGPKVVPPPPSQSGSPTQPKEPIPTAPVDAGTSLCKPDYAPSVAHVHVAVTLISNMEHGYHVLEEGAIFQIVQNNRIVIAGHATIDAVRNGRPTDGNGAYPGVILRLDATYSSVTASGSGELFMCQGALGVMPHQTKCETLPSLFPRDPKRPVEVRGHKVSWSYRGGGSALGLIEGGKVPQIDVQGANVTVSAYHPVFAAAAPGSAFNDFQSPLVLDLNKNGKLDLIDVWDESFVVRFDLEDSGQKVRTGWVAKEDGLLVLDVNGNGMIDSGRELFGEYSAGENAFNKHSYDKPFSDGFMALAQFDLNHDLQIDSKDPIFHKLMIWQDINSDGISSSAELKSLKAYGVSSLSLQSVSQKNLSGRFVKNNEVRILGLYRDLEGKTWGMADVWFKTRRYTDGFFVKQINSLNEAF